MAGWLQSRDQVGRRYRSCLRRTAPARRLAPQQRTALVFARSQLVNGSQPRSATMYELVSLVNRPGADEQGVANERDRKSGGGAKAEAARARRIPKARGRTSSRSRRRSSPLNGLAGARIDEIAAQDPLQQADDLLLFRRQGGALSQRARERLPQGARGRGDSSTSTISSPLEALRQLVEFTFDHHHQHEAFIRMVMIENIHHGEYPGAVARRSSELNVTAIDTIARALCARREGGRVPRRASIRSSCTGRSARSASSTSRTARHSPRSSAATSASPKALASLREQRRRDGRCASSPTP